MNRYREDTKYVYRPPRFSRFWAPLLYLLNDALYLRRRHRVTGVEVGAGAEPLRQLHRDGASLLITPNHSDHGDPHVLIHLSRRFRMPLNFMAAREIFELNWGITGIVLQRAGVFSIDREGSDLAAIKEALRIVTEARFPLVMFPEGEIYHLNARLTPLNEGAATIMLRAARKLAKSSPDRPVAIVPTAIRYRYVDDVAATFPAALDRLERHILWEPQSHLDIVKRIYKFGEAVLALKEKEYLGQAQTGALDDRLQSFRETLIGEAERRYLGQVSTGPHPERVRRLRGRLRARILEHERPTPDELRELYGHLDRIYFAIQLYSYPGQYLRDKPSPDRIAETILKFEEDLFRRTLIRGRRHAHVTFCPPLDMRAHLADYERDAKSTCHAVTESIQEAIRRVLEGESAAACR